MRLSMTVKEKGTDWGGGGGEAGKKKGTEGERLEERGQDEEKCWFEGGQEEMWAGQFSAWPEAKQRTEGRVPQAPCSADPINIIPIPVIC